ncbi:unnamed protein product [Paramecium sonneborni]|uniref:Transmembrane protein n=1 Tax=Paramecium sonneborni TaxID=65129 RepID=A0A8S1KSJ3_9CILI|nr:unnamed protein product [Paramecium sonneborni]
MNTFLKMITQFDGFFVAFNVSFGLFEQKIFFKSFCGGIASIIILTFILVYSLNQLVIWGSGEMIYKVSSQQKTIIEGSDLEQLFQNSNPIQTVEIEFLSKINAFNNNNMIMIPLLYIQQEDEMYALFFDDEQENSNYLMVDLDKLLYNSFNIIFVKCIGNEYYLDESQKCASQEASDEFFNQRGLLSFVNIYYQEFDFSRKTYEDYYSSIKLPLDPSLSSELQILTNFELTEINSGFLFQTKEEYLINSGCQSQIYTYSPNYHNQLYLEGYNATNIVGTVFLEINTSIFYVRNQYPTISEVLANIGSIIQTILLIRYLFYILNRKQMNSFIKSTLLQDYYPELKDLKEINKKNSCQLNDKDISKISIKKFQKQVDEMLNYKLDYINLIYELHQMQKILQLICPADILLKIHKNDSKLNIQPDPESNTFSIQNKWSQFEDYEDILNKNYLDPFFFSYYWKAKKKLEIIDIKSSLKSEKPQKICQPSNIQENVLSANDLLKVQNNKIVHEDHNLIIQN